MTVIMRTRHDRGYHWVGIVTCGCIFPECKSNSLKVEWACVYTVIIFRRNPCSFSDNAYVTPSAVTHVTVRGGHCVIWQLAGGGGGMLTLAKSSADVSREYYAVTRPSISWQWYSTRNGIFRRYAQRQHTGRRTWFILINIKYLTRSNYLKTKYYVILY